MSRQTSSKISRRGFVAAAATIATASQALPVSASSEFATLWKRREDILPPYQDSLAAYRAAEGAAEDAAEQAWFTLLDALNDVEWEILSLSASNLSELRMQALILRRMESEGCQAVEHDEVIAFIASVLAFTSEAPEGR